MPHSLCIVLRGLVPTHELPEQWWVLAGAVPTPRRIAEVIPGIQAPSPRLSRNLQDLRDAYLSIVEDLLVEPVPVRGSLPVHLPDEGVAHHRSWRAFPENPILITFDLLTVPWKGAVGNLRHVGGFADVLAPDEDIVCQVPRDSVAFLERGREHHSNEPDVIHVPSVAICKCRAVGDASDLVPVVPPRQDPCVSRSILIQPKVCLTDVVNDLPIAVLGHDLRMGERPPHSVERGFVEVQRQRSQNPQCSGRDSQLHQTSRPRIRNFQNEGLRLARARSEQRPPKRCDK
mmetsp:Transcript_13792/g.48708  ORF Transcript_13792/g.48708 Transcript_13792/m.48708 type:complete len:288 (-) Transcript_13792:158-1021(-)